MEHITEVLNRSGYNLYRAGHIFHNQNASAKEQYKFIMMRNDLIFIKGSKTTETAFFYYPFGSISKINDFSSMVVGGTDIRFVKDEDFENQFIWGLREYGKPPTLIHPRPKISVKRYREFNGKKYIVYEDESMDDSMNLCLSKENHEEILKNIHNKKKIYKYDLTQIE